MRSLLLSIVLGLASLGIIGLLPERAEAQWRTYPGYYYPSVRSYYPTPYYNYYYPQTSYYSGSYYYPGTYYYPGYSGYYSPRYYSSYYYPGYGYYYGY